MTALDASIATIESVCAIAEAQNGARKSERRDMRVSEEEFAEMQAKRSRWTRGGVVNTESMIGCALTRSPRQDANLSFDVPILQPSRRAVAPIPLERDVLSACLKALELHPRVAWAHRMNTGGMKNANGQYVQFGFTGMSDILGMLKGSGKFLAVECKRPGESLTLDQQAFLHRVIACGGVAFVARGVDDVMRALRPMPESA